MRQVANRRIPSEIVWTKTHVANAGEIGSKVVGMHVIEARLEHLKWVRELFLEYADSLEFDLGFQGFKSEISSLPGDYSAPRGALLLAIDSFDDASTPMGCIAMRPLDDEIVEMKRLFVRAIYQGQGIGRALTECLIQKAKVSGYKKMRLDTVPSMKAAIQMYGSLGFYKIPSYRENPVVGATCLELALN